MDEVREKLLSSAFSVALFEKWPELSFALETDRMLYRAIELASFGIGRTYPNPPVGSVIAKNGVVVAEGFHERAGLPHAEVNALKNAGDNAVGAEICVTLEPCAHHGRTPPCCDALIQAGVTRVLIGARDPNPHVDGGGLDKLVAAGVEARIIDNTFLQKLSQELIAPFMTATTKRRPYVVLQIASSLDGRVAAKAGEETRLSSKPALRISHRLRDKVDAVVVGRSTVEIDNPRLTVREVKSRDGRKPLRVVFDSGCRLSKECNVFADSHCVVIHESEAKPRVDVKHFGVRREGQGLSIAESLAALHGMGLSSILVEGGPHLWTSFLNAGVVDEVWWFDSPLILGAAGVDALQNLGPAARDWVKVSRHQSRSFQIGDDHLTIMRIQTAT